MLADSGNGQRGDPLPLVFGATVIALAFSPANFGLIARRIAIENRALAR